MKRNDNFDQIYNSIINTNLIKEDIQQPDTLSKQQLEEQFENSFVEYIKQVIVNNEFDGYSDALFVLTENAPLLLKENFLDEYNRALDQYLNDTGYTIRQDGMYTKGNVDGNINEVDLGALFPNT